MAQRSTAARPITTAVIVTKVFRKQVIRTILEVAAVLGRLGVKAYVDQSTAVGIYLDPQVAGELGRPALETLSKKDMRDKDLIVVVGGDGSVLGAARTLVDLRLPVLGINRGHLGLLTDVGMADLEEALTRVAAGRYRTEKRMMLSVTVYRPHEEGDPASARSPAGVLVGRSLATNETVIHSGMMAHMMDFNVAINERFMYSLRGDGMIVNTPTGSTAYALSAGGSIIEPHLDVLSLVPMFPQSLNCSPIIIPGKATVRFDFAGMDGSPEWVNISCDGQVTIRADTKCRVYIRQHPTPLLLLHPEGYDYYHVLRQKLGWARGLV